MKGRNGSRKSEMFPELKITRFQDGAWKKSWLAHCVIPEHWG